MNPFSFPVTENEPMSRHTTLRVGGPAQYFFVAKNKEDIIRAIREARERDIPYALLGGGSNTLVSDNGFNGLVIKMGLSGIGISGTEARAEAGVFSVSFARAVAAQGLHGVAWMVTLPGTVGGAIYGNAGAFGSETKDLIRAVEIIDGDGNEKSLPVEACEFSYRTSIFKKQKGAFVVLAATFELAKGNLAEINERMNMFLAKRKDEQPLGASSAGCMFRNHIDNGGKRVSAGQLIDEAGLKGLSHGKARVSERHANFCLNTGGATASDIRQLGETVRAKVATLYGIELEYEVQFLGF